ncbi:MAG: hypothetical protein WBE44_07720 [Terriglobales bacterium]|jgi:hypothetical protein
MTVTLILISTALLALALLVRLAKGRAVAPEVLENPTEHLRAVDVGAFRNLVDPGEEEFLRTNLAPAEFRKIQRERLRAAVEYVSCAAQNAGVLLRLADAGRRSSDPATAEAAEKLVNNALRLRLYALHTIPRLYLSMIFPGTRISPVRIAESYEQMTRQVVLLGCLQYPTRGVSAAL